MKKYIQRIFLCLLAMLCLPLTACNIKHSAQETMDPDQPVVYTSFYPIYDLTRQIAGDAIQVRAFMDLDKDPHLWEPTPRDLANLQNADLLIVNGANMERWLPSIRDSLPDLDILMLSDFVELITYKGAAAIGDFQYLASYDYEASTTYGIDFGHTHEDIMRVAFIHPEEKLDFATILAEGRAALEEEAEVIPQRTTIDVESRACYALEMGHETGLINFVLPESGTWYFYSDRLSEAILPYVLINEAGDPLEVEVLQEGSISGYDQVTYDPHSWLSISNTKHYVNAIYDELKTRYPEHERMFRRNKVRLIDAMTNLEFEFDKKFADLPWREFVVTHHAYAYLARDFNLKQYPLQGLISQDSPSLKTIRKALEFCQANHIKTIFYEYGRQKKGADTLALELDGDVVPLASLEYVTVDQQRDKNGYVDLMHMNLDHLYDAILQTNELRLASEQAIADEVAEDTEPNSAQNDVDDERSNEDKTKKEVDDAEPAS